MGYCKPFCVLFIYTRPSMFCATFQSPNEPHFANSWWLGKHESAPRRLGSGHAGVRISGLRAFLGNKGDVSQPYPKKALQAATDPDRCWHRCVMARPIFYILPGFLTFCHGWKSFLAYMPEGTGECSSPHPADVSDYFTERPLLYWDADSSMIGTMLEIIHSVSYLFYNTWGLFSKVGHKKAW